jgi:hypothetical protein
MGELTQTRLLDDLLSTGFPPDLFMTLSMMGSQYVQKTTWLDLSGVLSLDVKKLRTVVDQCPLLGKLTLDTPNLLSLSAGDPSLIKFTQLSCLCMSRQPNDGVLALLEGQRLSSIEKLSVTDTVFWSHHDLDMDKRFVDVLRQCSLLTDLSLSNNCILLTDVVIMYISTSMTSMTSLNISDGGSFSDACVDELCVSLSSLSTLKFDNCSTITIKSLISIYCGLPSLTSISFYRSDWMRDSVFTLLFSMFESLTLVSFRLCYFEGKRFIQSDTMCDYARESMNAPPPPAWLPPQTQLRNRRKFQIRFGSEELQSLIKSPKTITNILFQEDDVDSEVLLELIDTHGAQLQCLGLKCMAEVRHNVWLNAFSVPKSLTKLSIIRSLNISITLIVSLLESNPNITSLEFEGVDWLYGAECNEVLGMGISCHCQHLQMLTLKNIRINNTTIKHIGGKCTALRELYVASSTFFFDMFILEFALQKCQHLRVCSFDNSFSACGDGEDCDDISAADHLSIELD